MSLVTNDERKLNYF